MIPFATAPALFIGLGARVALDYFSRTDGPFIKDFILLGAWQGVALHYAAKTSQTAGLGIVVAFAIAAKLFIEFTIVSDVTRSVSSVLGVALGVLFTDFLSQHLDKPYKPSQTTERRRKKPQAVKDERKREKVVQFRPSVQGGSVETITDISTSLATSSHLFSDITSVDSNSEKLGPSSSLSPLEREIHALRTRAALADSERRRFKEERKWAISQGNEARAQQMKWEVKRYTTLTETFTREADLKAASLPSKQNNNGPANGRSQRPDTQPPANSPKDKVPRSSRSVPPPNGAASSTAENPALKITHQRRVSKTRDAPG